MGLDWARITDNRFTQTAARTPWGATPMPGTSRLDKPQGVPVPQRIASTPEDQNAFHTGATEATAPTRAESQNAPSHSPEAPQPPQPEWVAGGKPDPQWK